MKVIWVGLSSSALAVALIVVYGFLFGVQSRPNEPVTWVDVLYVPLIALLSGALAVVQLVLRSRQVRLTLRGGAALGLSAGTATGVLLLTWQLLFAVVVNLLLQRPGLFFVVTSAHPLNPTQRFVEGVFLLLFTFFYSMVEGFAAVVGGVLAGSLASLLYGAHRGRTRSDRRRVQNRVDHTMA